MDVYEIPNTTRDRIYGVAVDNSYISIRTLARILTRLPQVSDVQVRRIFSRTGTKISFEYEGCRFIVFEPFDDNAQLWIAPERNCSRVDVEPLKTALLAHRPSIIRHIIGNILSLRLFKSRTSIVQKL